MEIDVNNDNVLCGGECSSDGYLQCVSSTDRKRGFWLFIQGVDGVSGWEITGNVEARGTAWHLSSLESDVFQRPF